ncbi:Cyclophilin-type peptidyl-prolyl cis-trans isomerase domain [Dillenia turbinata]|uniref:Cyclophilin-type peptidyl-prolyl cis-trans isomerase domain n=1 Tax=Dillenia turbinata TaxID=194707 RepID=A0AAN8USB8_9MAGN
MLQNPKVLKSTVQFYHSPKLTSPQIETIPTSSSPQSIKLQTLFSRRELAICGQTLFFGSLLLNPFQLPNAQAEEDPTTASESVQQEENKVESVAQEETVQRQEIKDESVRQEEIKDENIQQEIKIENVQQEETTRANSCTDKPYTKRAFIDVSIDGEPVGRIVIGLYGENVRFGANRFSNLVTGKAGISYRRKEFIKIMPNYVQHGGVRSYGVDAELAAKTGSNLAAETLLKEWEEKNKCPGTKNLAGAVSIIVRDPSKPPPKVKLVARNGKLEIDEEEVGKDPNGTEFAIVMKDSPELDHSNLVVGRVLEGIEGGQTNWRQKGCCGGKRLQPPVFKGVSYQLRLNRIKRGEFVVKDENAVVKLTEFAANQVLQCLLMLSRGKNVGAA